MIMEVLLAVAMAGDGQELGETDYARYEIVPGSIRNFSVEDATRLQVSAIGKRWATVTVELHALRLGSGSPGARVASERRLLAVDCNTAAMSIQRLTGYAQPGLTGANTESVTAHFFGEAENFGTAGGFVFSEEERTRGFGRLLGNFLTAVCGSALRR